MNKTYLLSKRGFPLVAIACAAIAWGSVCPGIASAAAKKSPEAAPAKQGAGTLVVVRSANLGGTGVGISVDGTEVAKLNFNGRYEAPIAAGQHVLTTVPVPNREHAAPAQIRLNVVQGRTYKFTAARSDVAIVLK